MSVQDKINNNEYATRITWSMSDMEQRKKYRADVARLEAKLRADIEAEFDTAKFSRMQRDVIWAHAWEAGHSAGYSEVLSCYETAVNLIKYFV